MLEAAKTINKKVMKETSNTIPNKLQLSNGEQRVVVKSTKKTDFRTKNLNI